MRKRSALIQTTSSNLEWKYAANPNPIERLDAEKHTRGTTGPEGGTHSSNQEREQRGRILPRITSFLQFLRELDSPTQRRVNEMDKAGSSTLHFPYPKTNMSRSA